MAADQKNVFIKNGTVVTLGKTNRIIPDGAVWIQDDTIKAVGPLASLPAPPEDAEVLDAEGGLVMPGFINAHHHLYSTWARGIVPKSPPATNFVEILERLWWPLDRTLTTGDLYSGAIPPLADGLRHGTTTIIDHHESQSFQEGALDELASACKDVGVRGCLTLGISDRYGQGEAGVKENVRFIESIQGDPLLRGMMGLHALFTVNDNSLSLAIEAARSLDVGVHVHVAEDAADQEHHLQQYGMRVVDRLAKAGALGPKTIAVHGVHLSDEEIRALAQSDTWVVHNPESNMNNAVGVAPILKMLEMGVKVGLGTDAMTSNMLQEVGVAVILQRLHNRDPRVAFVEACTMLLNHNASLASELFGKPVGVLQGGALADIIILDYDPPTPLNEGTFLGHVLFGLTLAKVRTAMVGGRVRMHEGKVLGIDEARLMAESRERSSRFWNRFGKA